MQNCLYVMMGGALGALLRYAVGQSLASFRLFTLPIGTFAVNVVGCLLLGLLTGIAEERVAIPRHLFLLLTTGFCGAFTTFSTFSAETIKVAESGRIWLSALYVAASLVVGFLFFWWAKTWVK